MNTPKRFIHLGLFTLVLLALVTAGCGGANGADSTPAEDAAANDAPAQRSIRIETLMLQPDVFEDVIELTGTVESVNDATLSAQSSGTVEVLTPLGRMI